MLPHGAGDGRNGGGCVPTGRSASALGVCMAACAIFVLGHTIFCGKRPPLHLLQTPLLSLPLHMQESEKHAYGMNNAFMKGNLGGVLCFATV